MQPLTEALTVERRADDGDDEAAVADPGIAAAAAAIAGTAEQRALEALVGAALLTSTAFRLRDADGLVTALRALTAAVDALLRAQDSG